MECRCEAERAGADGPAPARGVQVERKQGCRACRGRARETAQRARPAGSVKGAVRGAAGVPRSHRRHSRRCAHTERGTPRLSLVEWFGRAELRWREEAKWWAEARAACGAARGQMPSCRRAERPAAKLQPSNRVPRRGLRHAGGAAKAAGRRASGRQLDVAGRAACMSRVRCCRARPLQISAAADAMPCRCAPRRKPSGALRRAELQPSPLRRAEEWACDAFRGRPSCSPT
jgi:hypothetical protein